MLNAFTGPMTRSVYDNALLLEAIAGPDWIDLRQADRPMPNPIPKYSSLLLKARERIDKEGLKGVKIGLLKEGFSAIGKDMNIETVVRQAADKFREMGATVVEVSCPSHFGLSQANTIVTTVGATGAMHGRAIGTKQLKLGGFWEGILPFNQERYSQVSR
jgi:amidase